MAFYTAANYHGNECSNFTLEIVPILFFLLYLTNKSASFSIKIFFWNSTSCFHKKLNFLVSCFHVIRIDRYFTAKAFKEFFYISEKTIAFENIRESKS